MIVKNNKPNDISEEDWERAISYATAYLKREIAQQYGCSTLLSPDIFRNGISDRVLASAIEHERTIFDASAFHEECRQFREQEKLKAQARALETARLHQSHPNALKRMGMNHIICHHRYQLPVGQGGFHVGTIKKLDRDKALWRTSLTGDAISDADFLYVYDCGSDPKKGVVREIKSVLNRRPSRRLDMLFISHFDRDHICGVPDLLNKRTGLFVDTVVMPYLDDIDRIIAFARCADISGDPSSERFYQNLIVDPVGTIRQFNPRQILLIPPSDEDDRIGRVEFPLLDPPSSASDASRWSMTDSISEEMSPRSVSRTSDGAILVERPMFTIQLEGQGGWRLKPHVKRASRANRDAFCAAVEVLLRWPRGSFYEKVQQNRERRLLVTKHRTEISRAYSWAFGEKNETSLSLYSGPVNPRKAGSIYRNMSQCPISRIGWLGTGDANLTDPKTVNDLKSHYRDELDWIMTFVLPHHGSAHNYDPANPIVDAELWIAAAAPTRPSWKHPAPEIVKKIKETGAKFRRVGSEPGDLLEERMVVFWPE